MNATTARAILSTIYVDTDGATLTSYLDPYGEDNAVRVGDRIAVLSAAGADDDGVQLFIWTGYDTDDEMIVDTQAGTADEVQAAITQWLA